MHKSISLVPQEFVEPWATVGCLLMNKSALIYCRTDYSQARRDICRENRQNQEEAM